MVLRNLILLFGSWLGLTLVSCQDEISVPITNVLPNDTSNGGGDNSPWILCGGVIYQNGELIAANPSDSSEVKIASATTREAKSFSGSQLVTFTWRETSEGAGIYQFSAGSDTSRLQNLPITELATGLKEAQLYFFLGFSEPLHSRFTFILPPSSSIRIRDYNSEGD